MHSLILTSLYLAKDTLNRWFTQLSSPLSRMLVVFFLSLCALTFLGTFVISTKLVQDKIQQQGADSVVLIATAAHGTSFPNEIELAEKLRVDSYVLHSIGHAKDPSLRSLPIASYEFSRSSQIYPMLHEGQPTLFCTAESKIPEGLRTVTLKNQPITVQVKHLPPTHTLMKIFSERCLILSPHTLNSLGQQLGLSPEYSTTYMSLKLQEPKASIQRLLELENYLRNFSQLNELDPSIITARKLLESMDLLLRNQSEARAIFCLGIASIVGILLTALSSMEFRQNEYIYTLMKSFGVNPIMLIMSFIIENIVLVALAFSAAIAMFMEGQKIILTQFFKTGKHQLSLAEIRPEIELIGASLLACVLLSAIPIALATRREIGRVLP